MRPPYGLAEAVRRFLPMMGTAKIPSHHLRTLAAIRDCRTAAQGGHVDACGECGHVRISYNSCRNRHCPKCQGVRKEMWLVQQGDMLLPVPYFHVVFTLPHEMNMPCMHGPRFMYGQLFRSAWHTLDTLALDKKWLGAKTAATMVLHTWSQTLVLHPHVHCIVPGGGLDGEGNWQFPKRGNGTFLFPVAAMKKVFRGHFMAHLKKALADGTLPPPKGFPTGAAYKKWRDGLYGKGWAVYTKKPFSKVHNAVNYLGRYSHRVALTDHRITGITDSTVSFTYKDYRDGAKKKEMTLEGTEFLRRFCLHILPGGFRKVRAYGFLSNASKAKSLALARRSLGERQRALLTRAERRGAALERLFPDGRRTGTCPCCQKGRMVTVHAWACGRPPPAFLAATASNN